MKLVKIILAILSIPLIIICLFYIGVYVFSFLALILWSDVPEEFITEKVSNSRYDIILFKKDYDISANRPYVNISVIDKKDWFPSEEFIIKAKYRDSGYVYFVDTNIINVIFLTYEKNSKTLTKSDSVTVDLRKNDGILRIN